MLNTWNRNFASSIGFPRFAGLSLLFDNPGYHSFSPLGSQLLRVDCHDATDTNIALYSKLRSALQDALLTGLQDRSCFVNVPINSYHVTVWDGLDEGNFEHIDDSKIRTLVKTILMNLPSSLLYHNEILNFLESASFCNKRSTLRLCYSNIELCSKSVRAVLRAADDESAAALQAIVNERIGLYDSLSRYLGYCRQSRDDDMGWTVDYQPHVTLGYFGTPCDTTSLRYSIRQINEAFNRFLGNITIEFSTISLYGFLDMELFFKKV